LVWLPGFSSRFSSRSPVGQQLLSSTTLPLPSSRLLVAGLDSFWVGQRVLPAWKGGKGCEEEKNGAVVVLQSFEKLYVWGFSVGLEDQKVGAMDRLPFCSILGPCLDSGYESVFGTVALRLYLTIIVQS